MVEPRLPAWHDIVNYFGKDILQEDQTIDRAKLGMIVFNDEEKRKKLESFIYPRLSVEVEKQEKTIMESNPQAIIIHDVPLLFESGMDKKLEKIIAVCVSEENQPNRLMKRDGISEEDARIRIRAQLPLADKVRRADFVIDNNGSIGETKRQIEDLYNKLRYLAQQK